MKIERIGPHALVLGNNCDMVGSQFFEHLLQGRSFSVVTDPPYGIPIMHEYADVKRSKAAAATGRNFKPVHGNEEEFDPTPWLVGVDQLFWGFCHFAHRLPHKGRELVWDKRCNIIPPRSQADFESAWCSEYGAGRMFYHYWDGMVKQSEMGESRVHPTQKPVELMSWCLQFAKGDVIFDPYMGSGTTGVAAAKAGRPFIGIEIEAEYFDAAVKRIRDAYAQPDFFTNDSHKERQHETV
jgi:site-specific DNA-methyltransferase (adenine-specific)/modification methylase